jgi:hypothetical protein
VLGHHTKHLQAKILQLRHERIISPKRHSLTKHALRTRPPVVTARSEESIARTQGIRTHLFDRCEELLFARPRLRK